MLYSWLLYANGLFWKEAKMKANFERNFSVWHKSWTNEYDRDKEDLNDLIKIYISN